MNEYIPETMEQAHHHYCPPIKRYIDCEDFGNSDGMNGGCHWCKEMTPYQFEMCYDASWLKGLMQDNPCHKAYTKEESIEFINKYKGAHN